MPPSQAPAPEAAGPSVAPSALERALRGHGEPAPPRGQKRGRVLMAVEAEATPTQGGQPAAPGTPTVGAHEEALEEIFRAALTGSTHKREAAHKRPAGSGQAVPRAAAHSSVTPTWQAGEDKEAPRAPGGGGQEAPRAPGVEPPAHLLRAAERAAKRWRERMMRRTPVVAVANRLREAATAHGAA